jgi:hypothetical protein
MRRRDSTGRSCRCGWDASVPNMLCRLM